MTMGPIYILITIFLNNTFVSLISLVLGIAVGIFPYTIYRFKWIFCWNGLVSSRSAKGRCLYSPCSSPSRSSRAAYDLPICKHRASARSSSVSLPYRQTNRGKRGNYERAQVLFQLDHALPFHCSNY